jgi:hypothetical protein
MASEAARAAAPRAVLAGPGAARALREGGRGRLEIALGTGGYARLDPGGWLLVTGPRAPVGPLSLLVAGLGTLRSQAGWAVRVEHGALDLGPHRIALDRLRVAAPPPLPPRAARLGPAVAAVLAACPPPPPALADGIGALERGDGQRAVALLGGFGDGLTPAGDDVLAGYAAWCHAAGAPVKLSTLAAGRSSPIGLAYLRCAERGELPDGAAALLAALWTGDAGAVARRARALRAWGSSSGAALAWGLAAAAARPPGPRAPSRPRPFV